MTTEPDIIEHVQPFPVYVKAYAREGTLWKATVAWVRDGCPMGYAPHCDNAPCDTYLLDWALGLIPLVVSLVLGLYVFVSAFTPAPGILGLGVGAALTGALSVLRYGLPAHEAAHTGPFGSQFESLGDEATSSDGGLTHAHWRTFDVMTRWGPRIRDERGIVETYKRWRRSGRIQRRRE